MHEYNHERIHEQQVVCSCAHHITHTIKNILIDIFWIKIVINQIIKIILFHRIT